MRVVLFSFFLFLTFTGRTQIIYQDSLISISGHISVYDSCIYLKFVNKSNLSLMLNGRNINYHPLVGNFTAAELGLFKRGGVSVFTLLESNYDGFKTFKRVRPKGGKYTAVAYDFPIKESIESVYISVRIDYFFVDWRLFFPPDMTESQIIEKLEKSKLEVNTYKGILDVVVDEKNEGCFYILKSR